VPAEVSAACDEAGGSEEVKKNGNVICMVRLKTSRGIRDIRLGMKVTTEFDYDHSDVVRTVTQLLKDAQKGSGYTIWMTGGTPCSKCGHVKARPIEDVDAAWAEPYLGRKDRKRKDSEKHR